MRSDFASIVLKAVEKIKSCKELLNNSIHSRSDWDSQINFVHGDVTHVFSHNSKIMTHCEHTASGDSVAIHEGNLSRVMRAIPGFCTVGIGNVRILPKSLMNSSKKLWTSSLWVQPAMNL